MTEGETVTTDELEEKVEQILRDADAFQVPVPLDRVARHLNLTIEAVHLEDISGVLVVNGNSGGIAYNSAHSVIRSRLAVAHEISHFILHARKEGKPQVFADRRVSFRRPGDDLVSPAACKEVQANEFGRALLMPRSAVLKEIAFYGSDLDEEKDIEFLASRFRVSIPSLTKRLTTLSVLLF